MKQLVELRIRQAGRPAFRYELGYATSRANLLELSGQRDLLRRLHDRGEHDVLDALKDGRTTAAELARLVDQHGIADYRRHLKLEVSAATASVPTLDDHVAHWLDTIGKKGTRGVYRKSLAHLRDYVHEGARLGDGPWHAVPRHVIRDAKRSAAKRLESSTVRTLMGAWSAFFEWALDRDASEAERTGRPRLITENPVRAARDWDPITTTRHRFLTPDEFWHWIESSPEPMKAQYATLTFAGLRIEELLVLPPAHMHIPTHLHIGPWSGWVPKGYPRSKRGVRDIPIHRQLLPYLERYAELYAGQDTFFVNPSTGQPWKRSAFETRMRKDIKAAGLVYGQFSRKSEGGLDRKPQGITPHTCRHTLASWLAQADVQLMKIAAILGDTVETVVLHYAHLVPKDLDQAINRVGGQ